MNFSKRFNLVLILISAGLLGACNSLQMGSDPYKDAWEQVVQSRRWETSIKEISPSPDLDHEVYYAIPSYGPLESASVTPEFMDRYPALVSRAYFRLIAEALDADRRISKTYQEIYRETRLPENQQDPVLMKEFETAQRRFIAHREMLEGLRIWRAFNEYGSDDLDFFMQEQLPVSFEKYQRGVTEDKLIDYLMRRLADLYHLQHGGMTPAEMLPG